MNPISTFLKNVLLSIDQFGNVLLFGSADETISARSYRKGALEGKRGWKVMRWAIDKMFFFDKNHTKEAYRAEQCRAHMPEAYQSQDAACKLPETQPEDKS